MFHKQYHHDKYDANSKERDRVKVYNRLRNTCIVSAIVCVVMIGFLVTMYPEDKIQESDTVELEATIRYIELTGQSEKYNINIYTEEFNNSLTILSEVAQNIDVNELNAGEKIIFRIPTEVEEYLNKEGLVYLVSCRIQESELLSIGEYNVQISRNLFLIRGICAGIGLVTFILFLISLITIMRLRKRLNSGD